MKEEKRDQFCTKKTIHKQGQPRVGERSSLAQTSFYLSIIRQ